MTTFRPATPGDAEPLARAVLEGFETYRSFTPPEWEPPPLDREVERQRLRSPTSTWVLLAEADERLVGQVSILPSVRHVRPEPDPSLAHFRNLFVAQDHWGTGLATTLHAASIEEARDRGFEQMRLFTPAEHGRARRFYEREGWTQRAEPFDEPAWAWRSWNTASHWRSRVVQRRGVRHRGCAYQADGSHREVPVQQEAWLVANTEVAPTHRHDGAPAGESRTRHPTAATRPAARTPFQGRPCSKAGSAGCSARSPLDPGRRDQRARGADAGRRRAASRDNPKIPAGYTYFGQFVDHDITFDPMSAAAEAQRPRRAGRLPHAALRPRLALRLGPDRRAVPLRVQRPANRG